MLCSVARRAIYIASERRVRQGEEGYRVNKVKEGKQLHEVVLDGGPTDDDRHSHRYSPQLGRYQRPRILDLVALPAQPVNRGTMNICMSAPPGGAFHCSLCTTSRQNFCRGPKPDQSMAPQAPSPFPSCSPAVSCAERSFCRCSDRMNCR
jgi:hypothetical protein